MEAAEAEDAEEVVVGMPLVEEMEVGPLFMLLQMLLLYEGGALMYGGGHVEGG